jgi:hypothetical protein
LVIGSRPICCKPIRRAAVIAALCGAARAAVENVHSTLELETLSEPIVGAQERDRTLLRPTVFGSADSYEGNWKRALPGQFVKERLKNFLKEGMVRGGKLKERDPLFELVLKWITTAEVRPSLPALHHAVHRPTMGDWRGETSGLCKRLPSLVAYVLNLASRRILHSGT